MSYVKLAYDGKIEHHGAKHISQAILLLAAKKDKIGQYMKKMHTNNAPLSSLVGIVRGMVESSVSFESIVGFGHNNVKG